MPKIQLILLLAVLTSCGGAQIPPPPPRPDVIGRTVDLTLPSLDGDEVNLNGLRGKVVVVHFSTTGSIDAQADIEELRRTRAARKELALVEIALDPTQPKLIAAWANASNIDWLVLLPTPGMVTGDSPFGPVKVTPTTFLLDRTLHIVWGHEGRLPRGGLGEVVDKLEAAPPHP